MKKGKTIKVAVSNLQDRVEINESLMRRAAALVISGENESGELSILFASDDYVKGLNSRYLSKNCPTDVLAFPMGSDGLIGDVAVSADRAAEQALEYGHSVEKELVLLAVHGALHLFGYTDECPEGKEMMDKRQEEILRKVFP